MKAVSMPLMVIARFLSGLDTLVVHAVNDFCGWWVGRGLNAQKLPGESKGGRIFEGHLPYPKFLTAAGGRAVTQETGAGAGEPAFMDYWVRRGEPSFPLAAPYRAAINSMGRPNGRDAGSTSNWSHRCRVPTSPNPSPDPDEIHDHEQTLARGNHEQIHDEQTHDRHRGNREKTHAHHHDHVPVRARRLLPWRDRNNRRQSGPPSPTSASCAWVKRHLLSSRPPIAMSGRCGSYE
jgi:hypothetical protein